jgi:hypothetical protein
MDKIEKNEWKTCKRIWEILNNKVNSSSNATIPNTDTTIEMINEENVKQQLNYFPKNQKHIDYVIYYKEIEDAKKLIENNRKKFFSKLELEEFNLHFLKQTDVENTNIKHVFVLLNCSLGSIKTN